MIDTAHVEAIVDEITLELSGHSVSPQEELTVSGSKSVADDFETAASAFRVEARVARLERAMSSVLRFLQPAARRFAAESPAKRTKDG